MSARVYIKKFKIENMFTSKHYLCERRIENNHRV